MFYRARLAGRGTSIPASLRASILSVIVITGLDPVIQRAAAWIAGSSPAMTLVGSVGSRVLFDHAGVDILGIVDAADGEAEEFHELFAVFRQVGQFAKIFGG